MKVLNQPTVSEPPLSYFENNLMRSVIGEWRAGFWIPSTHFEYRSEEDLVSIADQWTDFFSNLKDEAHLLVIPRKLNVLNHMENLMGQVIDPLKEYGKGYYKRVTEHLLHNEISKKPRETFMYDFYILLRLRETNVQLAGFKEKMGFRLKDVKRTLDSFSGVADQEIFEEEIRSYQHQEEVQFTWMQEHFGSGCRRMTGDEIASLVKRSFWRGISEPSVEGYRIHATPTLSDPKNETATKAKKSLRPKKSDILRLTGGLPDDDHGRVLINRQYVPGEGMKEGLMSFLVLSHIPDDRPVPGTDWLYWLQTREFPVEASIRVVPQDYEKALQRARNAKKELEDQAEHIEEHGGSIPRHLDKAIDNTDELEGELVEDNTPILETTATICVFGSDRAQLDSRMDDLIKKYGEKVFHLDIPYGDQFKLFNEFIPGSPIYLHDYKQTLDPVMIAGAFFGSTRSLGDRGGIYLGRSAHYDVFCDFKRGPQDGTISKPPNCCLVGTAGGGKTLTADVIVLENVQLDAQALFIDPKNDRGHWVDFLPDEFKEITELIRLKPDKRDRGKLDPLASNGKDGAPTARKILQILTAVKDGSYHATALSEAVEHVLEEATPDRTATMGQVLQHLHHHYETKIKGNEERTMETKEKFSDMLYALDHHSQYGQGQLLFSDGSQKSIDLSKRMTILQIQDLELPEDGHTEGERLGVALLVALSDYAKAFSNLPSDRFKICVFDEAWRMRKTKEGRDALKSLIREGRSKNSALFIISQNATDLNLDDTPGSNNEEVQNNLGLRIVFGPKTEAEAKRLCDLLAIEPTKANVKKIKTLKPGEFFFHDWEGRVNKVRLNLPKIHPELFRILDSRPNKRSALLKEKAEETARREAVQT